LVGFEFVPPDEPLSDMPAYRLSAGGWIEGLYVSRVECTPTAIYFRLIRQTPGWL